MRLIARRAPFWEVELPAEAVAFFDAHGLVPLPPYIDRPADPADRERYQSLLARVPGAVAAPTASLHFDESLLAALAARGIERSLITLHVGAGTFQPLRSESLEAHVMHSERYEVGAATVAAIARARARRRRDRGRHHGHARAGNRRPLASAASPRPAAATRRCSSFRAIVSR